MALCRWAELRSHHERRTSLRVCFQDRQRQEPQLRITCGFLRSVVSTFRRPVSGAPGMLFAVWMPEVSASAFHSLMLRTRPLKPLLRDPLSKTESEHTARGPRAAPPLTECTRRPWLMGSPSTPGVSVSMNPHRRPPAPQTPPRSSRAIRKLAEGRTLRSESAQRRPERPQHAGEPRTGRPWLS